MPPLGAAPFEPPPAQRGANLADCRAKLEKQGGGWCKIRLSGGHPSISSVWPPDLDRRTRMVVGPRAVLIAWNGAAFDEESLFFYFMGGGHADYGGNEVYEFDLKTERWARLTDALLPLSLERNNADQGRALLLGTRHAPCPRRRPHLRRPAVQQENQDHLSSHVSGGRRILLR